MQVIPDNLQITTGYHVFETPDDIIINSQMYDKFTMQPKDYCFWNTNYCLNNKNLLLHEINILEYSWGVTLKEHNYEYYIQDNMNPNIFYFLTEQGPTNSDQYLCKVQKTETSWEILNAIAPDSGYRYEYVPISAPHYKLLGQTNEYIFMYQINNGGRGRGHPNYANVPCYQTLAYIIISKSNMSAKSLNVGVYYSYAVFKLKEQSNEIYLYESLAGNINIIRLDPYSNKRTVFYTFSDYANSKCVGLSNMILFKDKYYVFTNNASSNGYAFQIFTIDFENNIVTRTEKVIPDIEGFIYHSYPINRNDWLDCSWLQIDIKNIDDTYIAITTHDNANYAHGYQNSGHENTNDGNRKLTLSYTAQSQAEWHRHALIKYDEQNDEWISKGIITPDESTQHIYGVLYYDQYTPIFFMNNKIQIQRLNLETEKYEEVLEILGVFNTIGLDSNNTLYLFDNNNKCTTYNTASSNQLEINFEKSQYKYNNQTINTYVTVYSKNLLNEYISSSVKITLSGNCQFTNGDKELYTNTNSNGPINIPVAITYGGKIYCYIEEV